MAAQGEDQHLRAIALRLDLLEIRCRRCETAHDAECWNCGGSGRVWEAGRGRSTLSDEGLLRLARSRGILP